MSAARSGMSYRRVTNLHPHLASLIWTTCCLFRRLLWVAFWTLLFVVNIATWAPLAVQMHTRHPVPASGPKTLLLLATPECNNRKSVTFPSATQLFRST